MFLPLRDALPTSRVPVITIALVLINVLVYVLGLMPANLQAAGSSTQISNHQLWVTEFGAIPCEVHGRCANQDAILVIDGGWTDPTPREVSAQVNEHHPVLTLFTSMFLHGGFVHLLFNMLFLWVFGNNVEDAMHRLGFLGFYLVAGLASGIAQTIVTADSTLPTVGASGAIAAVLGAYVFLYPRTRVLTLVFFPFFWWLPAWIVVGGWAVLQALGTWASLLNPIAPEGGVAYMAHFAGFLVGLLAIGFFAERRNVHYQRLYGDGARPAKPAAVPRRMDDEQGGDSASTRDLMAGSGREGPFL